MKLSVWLTTLVTGGAFAMGIAIYEDYRTHVKRGLFALDPEVGMLFETKEHLAFATLALALAAGLAALLAPRKRADLRKAAAALYAASAITCLVVVALGTYVASVRSFPQ